MGLFTNKKSASKPWSSVLKNLSLGGEMIWLHPDEDFNINSTLIVQPGEEAIFVKSGHVEQVFTNGTYTLKTENYPFISHLINKFSDNTSRFNCRVFFVRVASSIELLWGTDSPIQVRDKFLGIQTDLRARGSYKVQVNNASLFLTKLIGNGIKSYSPQDIKSYFGCEFISEIKSRIAQIVNEMNQEILGIASRATEFAKIIEPSLKESLAEYGVELLKFVISGIDFADDELRRKYDAMGIDARGKVINAQADKNVMDILGDKWQQQQQFDIMRNFSMNSGNGVSSAGAEIGAGMAMGAAFFGMGNQINQQPSAQNVCPPPITQWYIYVSGQQIGPLNMQQIKEYIVSGQLSLNDLVWKNGFAEWVSASNVPEIKALFTQQTPPIPPIPHQ